MRIAMTGNPNSGKTTMFNALTGRSERVGNWAGVTVDKRTPSKKDLSGWRKGINCGRFTGSIFDVTIYIGRKYYEFLC